MSLKSEVNASQSTPTGRHSGDPRDKMKIPRKAKLSPQDPSVHNINSSTIALQPTVSNDFSIPSTSPQQLSQQVMLAPGVSLPQGMDPSILLSSEHALTLLKQLPSSQQQASLLEFHEAMKNKGNRVRNAQAYLVGVIKRYITVTRKERCSSAPVMGKSLTPVVKVSLQKMVDSGFCTQKDLGDKVVSKMKLLSERDVILAIEEIFSVQRDKIRNFTSYFIGILNRYLRGEETPHQHRSAQGFQPKRINNNNEPNKRLNDRRGRRSHRDDDDRHRRSPSDRRRRSRSPESDYEDKKYRRRRGRYRSRDDDSDDDVSHSSSDRDYRRSRRDRDRDRSRSRDRYDKSRDRGRHEHGRRYRSRSRSTSRSPGYNRSHRDSRHSSRRSDKGSRRRSNGINVKPMPIPLPSPLLAPFPGTSLPPPPPPPPPRNIMSTVSGHQTGWPSTNGNISQQFAPLLQPPHNLPTVANDYPHSQQIGGLQSSTQFGKPVGGVQLMTSTDILGIAEKAASAVQALSRGMTKPPNRPPSMVAPLAQQQHHTQMSNQQNSSSNHNVTTKDLNPMVQFAVKNLQATGHLDKELGSNACNLLQKLPSTVALHCLEKFSSCDASIMRSKEGYLIGILRKAANKNQ